MTTTATAPAPVRAPIRPTTGVALWWLIPVPVRQLIRAVIPLDSRQHGCGTEGLIVAVGPGAPCRWLAVQADDAGALDVRLWEVRRAVKCLAAEACTPAELPALLTRWAKAYGLSG